MTKKPKDIAPPQLFGKSTGASSSEKCATHAEAIALYNLARERLLHINGWYSYTGESVLSGKFQHTDENGRSVERAPKEGDFIRIELPGVGPESGDGFDWVQIERIAESQKDNSGEDSQFCAIRVRPAPNPATPSEETAHFFTELATSTFQVSRAGKVVIAEEIGRNEMPNNEDNDKTKDTIRNTIYAETASRGASWPQWKVLMSGFLTKDNGD